MKTSEKIDLIAPALLKAQSKMSNAVKGSSNPFFKSKYADLNAIREAVMPALNEEGISVLQPHSQDSVQTVLMHESGQWIMSETSIVSKSDNNPQDHGSAISYARRYSLQSLLCIGAEDDDAEAVASKFRTSDKKEAPKATHKKEEKADDIVIKSISEAATLLMNKNILTLADLKAKLAKLGVDKKEDLNKAQSVQFLSDLQELLK